MADLPMFDVVSRLARRLARPPSPLPSAPEPDLAAQAYELLYARALEDAERHRLSLLGAVRDEGGLLGVMRRIVSASEGARTPCPVLIRFGRNDVTWIEDDGFALALDAADVAVSQYLMQKDAWEPHVKALFQRTVRPGMSIFDVGANIGYYSLLSASLMQGRGRVVAYEPNSENNRLHLLSIERNGFDSIQLVPTALSNRLGHAVFSVGMGSNGGLKPPENRDLLGDQCVVVPTLKLDDVADGDVDFIKMDVEGAEALVVDGAVETIARCKPVVSSEFSPLMISAISGSSPLEFLQRFRSWGYSIHLLDKSSREEGQIEDEHAFLADFGSMDRIEDIVFRPPAGA